MTAPGVGAMAARVRAMLADPSVRWLAIARAIALLASPVSLYLLVTRYAESQRGGYLIAINVVMLGQLFETGMGTLVVQFAARARPSERGQLRGAAERWFGRAAIVAAILVAAVGFGVVARMSDTTSRIAWIVVVLTLAGYVRLVPLICLREGGGASDAVQRFRAAQAVAIAAAIVVGLWMGGGVVAAAIAGVAQLVAAVAFIARERRALPAADRPGGRLDGQYRVEQGRSARVWIALWLAPQLLTPAVMFFRGAAPAGDIGLHVALALAPPVLATAWLHGRYPRFGALVAAGALRTFDDTAREAFTHAMRVFAIAAAGVLLVTIVAPWLLPFVAGRTFSPLLALPLLVGSAAIVAFQAMLAWLRAFGDERFGTQVVIGCAAMCAGGVGGAAIGGAMGAALGYAGAAVVVSAILAAGFGNLRAQRLANG